MNRMSETSVRPRVPMPLAATPPTDRLLFINAAQVVTCDGPPRARRGAELRDLGILTTAAVAVDAGIITAVGPQDELERANPGAHRVDCKGMVLMPGLVDSHTHALFGKPRYEEQEQRAGGLDYMEIARRGGGIHASVRDLRARERVDRVLLTVPGQLAKDSINRRDSIIQRWPLAHLTPPEIYRVAKYCAHILTQKQAHVNA